MTLNPIAANQTETEHKGTTCFYSYSTLVAVFVTGSGAFVTSEHHSKTTSRHINKCLARWGATKPKTKTVTPEELAACAVSY